jgi:dTDP-4-dehydrorhamnose 3,5-epimerase
MSSKFDFLPTKISDLVILQRKPIGDDRGYFERMFCLNDLDTCFQNKKITQINHTCTMKRGSVRGLHFQYPPHAEVKFVSCVGGEIFDVAVDLRQNSKTFLQWHGEILSAKNYKTMIIPEGFAHGFQTLSDESELIYFHSHFHHATSESGLNVLDTRLGIEWPLEVQNLSRRDAEFQMLETSFSGVIV